MNVALIDDEPPARQRLRRMLGAHADVQVLWEAQDGNEALDRLEQQCPDVVFMDIEMPGASGLELTLRLPAQVLCVFCTAHAQHALQAFDLQAIDYLLKPFDARRLEQALQRLRGQLLAAHTLAGAQPAAAESAHANERGESGATPLRWVRALLANQPTAGTWWVERLGVRMRLALAQLEWVEAADNYITLHAPPDTYLERRTLADFLAHPDVQGRFVRVHRSYAVQVACITAIAPLPQGEAMLTLRSGHQLKMSRRQRAALTGLQIT